VTRAISQFNDHNGSQMGAALAYYALFSTVPLLMLAVMLAGMFFGSEAAFARMQMHLNDVLGQQSAAEITSWMKEASQPKHGVFPAIVSFIVLIIGATGVFLHVRRCLCVIWRLESKACSGYLMTLINYLLAIGAALIVGLLLLLSLVVSTATNVVVKQLGEQLPGGGRLWQWVEVGSSVILLAVFFTVLYRVLSGRKISWGYCLYGAAICSILFVIGKWLISLYLAYTSTASIYGAAGSLVVFLVWIYYSAQIAFFGAELIEARRTRSESQQGSA
jgi:membrane protein